MSPVAQTVTAYIIMAGGVILFAFLMLLDQWSWTRRNLELARQCGLAPAKCKPPEPSSIEELIAAAPAWRFYAGPDHMGPDAYVVAFSIGKDQLATWGSMLYRLQVSLVYWPNPRVRGFVHYLQGPFTADSSSWTGHKPLGRHVDAIAYGSRPRFSMSWGFYR